MNKYILQERALNMRINPTKSERAFRDRLELKGINYRTQVVIGKYIADFVIGKTIYEIDGSSHDGKEVYDTIRDADLRMLGYKVVHIRNSEVQTYDFYKDKLKSAEVEQPKVKEDYIPTPLEAIRLAKQQERKMNKVIKPKQRKPKNNYFKKYKPSK